MSQADELLNSLPDAEISLALVNPDAEPHIIIGEDRFISVPKELQRIAVQYDHNIETVTFDCPRYWDDLDMSQLSIYINYMRSDRVVGCYKAQNITVDTVDSSVMHFDWTISRNVSLAKGSIKFLVCIKKGDEDGNEVNHWNSELNTDMYISEGLETGESFSSSYPDIILQWEDDVQRVKDMLLSAKDSGEFDGATFIPSIDEAGNLSWTNDQGLENPNTVNIKGHSPSIIVREIDGGRELIITDIRQTQTVTILDGTDGADGNSPTITVEAIEGGNRLNIVDANGTKSVDIPNGTDGVSPTVAISSITNGHQVTITDKDGAKSFNVLDGTDGVDGDDGISPTISIADIAGGHRVTITDATGTKSFDVMDGTQDISEAVNELIDEAKIVGKGVITAGSSTAYTATVPGITALELGLSFIMIPHITSTTTDPTLNVNNLGAKSLRIRVSGSSSTTTSASTADWLVVNKPIRVTYDGMFWVAEMVRPNANDIYGTVSVPNGGTGLNTLTAGSYMVGNGIEDVVLKTPAEVLADIGAAPTYTYGTEDLVAGTSELETGKLYFVYE